jgi:hypothetical protein
MDAGAESTGLKGVGFLFGLIFLFLLVVCLKQTGHSAAAAVSGAAGCILLALSTGAFLLQRWRIASDEAEFHADGDVPFALAVFLLVLIAPALLAIRVSPLMITLLLSAAIPVRTFVRSLRHPR